MKAKIHDALFESSPAIRYVAVRNGSSVELHQRDDLDSPSESESDKYEELFVNPAILSLATNRGELDCGGLNYVLIRYGNFFQYIRSTVSGHVSIAIETDANLDEVVPDIEQTLHQLSMVS
ncbi:MAG TPA: hypothetical protein DDW52_01485 [Planctomycetaceae bacterium]|nr:hypothetical protein [Planctomycetaceae bacterium]